MSGQRRATYDLDRVFRELNKGIQRADTFMGIGLNAADHDPPISHVLDTGPSRNFMFTKEKLSQNELNHVKVEFFKWIQANGLRELVESISLFFDRIYEPMYWINNVNPKHKELMVSIKHFLRYGIVKKIELFRNFIDISAYDIKVIYGLNKLRNCYAHRLGLVGFEDVENGSNFFNIYWHSLGVIGVEPNGNVVEESEFSDYLFKQGGNIVLRFNEKIRSFGVGEEVVFTKIEIKEICFTVRNICQRVFEGILIFFENSGNLHKI